MYKLINFAMNTGKPKMGSKPEQHNFSVQKHDPRKNDAAPQQR
jgi:hypothetical protein